LIYLTFKFNLGEKMEPTVTPLRRGKYLVHNNNIIIFRLKTTLFLKVKNSYMHIFRIANVATLRLNMKTIKRKINFINKYATELRLRVDTYGIPSVLVMPVSATRLVPNTLISSLLLIWYPSLFSDA